jgi:hypothetical protein
MVGGTLKSSTIFIATQDGTDVYRCVQDVPPALRKKLAASTGGVNSATILIADRRGKDEIARLVRSLPAGSETLKESKLDAAIRPGLAAQALAFLYTSWPEAFVSAAIGLLAWLLLSVR